MAELDFNNNKDSFSKPELEQVQKEKQEFKLIDKITRTKGLKLFAYNQSKDEVFEVILPKDINNTLYTKVEDGQLVIDYDKTYDKAVIDPRNIHFEALNLKNAIKRVGKWKSGKIKDLDNLRRNFNKTISFF